MTPSTAIHTYCRECLGLKLYDANDVKDCQGDKSLVGSCPFYPYRLGKRAPIKAFRAFCLQCMGKSYSMVEECQSDTCPCYIYRFGKNPSLAGKLRGGALHRQSLKKATGHGYFRQD